MPIEEKPDLPTAVAAMTTRYTYTFVAKAVADHHAGHDELPGTMPYNAVLAWRAALTMMELMTAVDEA